MSLKATPLARQWWLYRRARGSHCSSRLLASSPVGSSGDGVPEGPGDGVPKGPAPDSEEEGSSEECLPG